MIPISAWQPEERPREKCLSHGVRSLSTSECLALILQTGSHKQSALDLARTLLQPYDGDLSAMLKASPVEWEAVPGIGPAKSARIAAALELSRRLLNQPQVIAPCIKSSKDSYDALKDQLDDIDHEEFWVLYLSQANRVLHKACIGKGGWSQTLADSRVIYQVALTHKACGIIVAHNHPSGRLHPSHADRQLTKRLQQVAKMLDITFLDHLIIGKGDYVSFADKGWLLVP